MLAGARALVRFVKNDRKGVTAVEYGLIAALIAAVMIGSLATVGTDIRAVLTTIGTAIAGV